MGEERDQMHIVNSSDKPAKPYWTTDFSAKSDNHNLC